MENQFEESFVGLCVLVNNVLLFAFAERYYLYYPFLWVDDGGCFLKTKTKQKKAKMG